MGLLLALPLIASPVLANPLSATVTTGSASVASSSNKTQIDQKSEDVVINWSSFNIGAGQTTQFVQPNAQAIAVNRIGGNAASQILGTLDANGRIVLINGNGMLFGKGAAVNVGALIATSTGGSDSDVLSGKFTQASNRNAAVVNQGRITTSQGGLVALVAPSVTNAGLVDAKFGAVALGAANKFTVDFAGDGLVSFATQGDVNGRAMANNTGRLVGANVSLTARAAEGLATGVVNMSGTILAQTAHQVGGTIVLDAGGGGDVIVSNTKLNASGANGGGSIQLGGWNENSVTVDKASVLNASATQSGNGGAISVIASNTSFEGAAFARGGAQSGNGGTIETSGHVVDTQNARINASAANGSFGNWSLDPENVTICTAATTNGALSGGVFTPSGDDSVLNVRTFEKALKRASVDVTTGSTGSQAGDITIVSKLAWASGSTLTLDAYHSILVDGAVTITGAGNLDLVTNDGGSGGTFNFGGSAKDHVAFDDLSSGLTINGNAYTLVGSIATLASDIAANPNGDYALASSYDARTDGVYASSPIISDFTGSLDGLGNTIGGLHINDPVADDAVGFFRTLEGSISNLVLSNVKIEGAKGSDVGAIAGDSSGSILGVTVSGSVIGGQNADIGGLVGDGYGSIAYSSTSGTVTGGLGATLGGLIGGNGSNGGMIANSFSSANVMGGVSAGGVAGANAGTIEDSYGTGAVLSGDTAGGLVGDNTGTIYASFATGAVSGGGEVGGLVGLNGNDGTISNAFAMGAVHGGRDVGGLVGENDWQIAASYATGPVSGVANSFVGGVVGADLTLGGIANSYWDTTISGLGNLSEGAGNLANDTGITGDSTAQLQMGLPSGFSGEDWGAVPRVAFPYLKWQAPTGTPQVISGTFTGPEGSTMSVLVDGTSVSPLVSMNTQSNNYYYLLLAPNSMPANSDVLVYDADMTGARLTSMTSSSLANFNILPGTLLQYTRDNLYSAMADDLETAIGGNAAVQNFIDGIPNYDITSTAGSFTIDQPLNIFTRTDIADTAGYLTISTPQSWTSESALTLQGRRGVEIDNTVAVAGTGGLNIIGQLDFNGGNMTFADLADRFSINGKVYTLVDTIAQLDAAAQSGGNIALANNYDASVDGTYSESPVTSIFNAGVEGLGNTISNLSIDETSGANVGLFGYLKNGLIENLILANVSITAVGKSASGVGGLAGLSYGAKLLNDSVNGNISASNGYVGGLVGINEGIIEYSSSSGTVTGANAGGLVGENGVTRHGVIDYVYSSATVGGSSIAGGLVAESSVGTISNSYATGSVTWDGVSGLGVFGGLVGEGAYIYNSYATGTVTGGNNSYVGGLMALGSYIYNSYATGAVSAGNSSYVGGLTGLGSYIYASYASGTVSGGTNAKAGGLAGDNGGVISGSYATGAVTIGDGSEGAVGGLVGTSDGPIQNSYATGSATGGTSAYAGGLAGANYGGTITDSYSTVSVSVGSGGTIGGLIGYDSPPQGGSVFNSYWDTTTSGVTNLSQGAGNISNDPGITGLTTTQLQSGLPAGFNSTIWGESATINGGLPYLLALPPS